MRSVSRLRLRPSLTRLTIVSLAIVGGALTTFATAAQAPPSAPADTATRADPTAARPTRDEIAAAIARLKTDPNLGTEKKTRQLRRNAPRDMSTPPGESPGWLKWIANAFGWVADTARVLVWIIAIILIAALAIFIKRFLESRAGPGSASLRFNDAAPTHVRDLDIRPESLPDDIGRAALELWERAEHRAAMSLLYRGLLSRLAHVHGVPIRDSSTEGDCLALATAHLATTRAAYVGKLIRAWQRAVYGYTEPTTEEVQTLCAGFAAAVDEPAPIDPVEKAA